MQYRRARAHIGGVRDEMLIWGSFAALPVDVLEEHEQ